MPFNDQQTAEFKKHFDSFDKDGDGHITQQELTQVLKALGEYSSLDKVGELIASVDTNKSGAVEFNEFIQVMENIQAGSGKTSAFAKVYEKQKELIQHKGHSGVHSFSQEEMSAFAEHLNYVLKDDADLAHLLPVDPNGTSLCTAVRDGLLLCKFINKAVPKTIDERVLNKPKSGKPLSLFQITENQNLCIASAKAIGVVITNMGASELTEGEKHPHLVLGMTWQLVKIHLLNQINLKNFPELVRLLEDGETLEDLLKLPPDQLLLRWFNYHLKAAGHPRRVKNFAGDVKDSECYTVLLNQIAPGKCDRSALNTTDLKTRAEKVIGNAEKVGAHAMIKPRDIVAGNPRLNLAFTAAVFNACPGLDPLTEEEEMELAGLFDDDFGDSREERAFRMWINTLGIDDLYVNNLFDDLQDGLVLLKVFDHIEPGIVSWRQVEKNPNNKFKKVSNCNYAVVLGKQLKFSLVGIGGVDITNGNKKLVLALVWQLMRHHIVKFLSQLSVDGKAVTDQDIINWCNKTTKAGKMSSFKDKSLSDGVYFVNLLAGLEPRIIDWDLVTPGKTEEDAILNARYAISIARKLGAVIFLLPEDIYEVKPKMIMTFCAAVFRLGLERQQS